MACTEILEEMTAVHCGDPKDIAAAHVHDNLLGYEFVIYPSKAGNDETGQTQIQTRDRRWS